MADPRTCLEAIRHHAKKGTANPSKAPAACARILEELSVLYGRGDGGPTVPEVDLGDIATVIDNALTVHEGNRRAAGLAVVNLLVSHGVLGSAAIKGAVVSDSGRLELAPEETVAGDGPVPENLGSIAQRALARALELRDVGGEFPELRFEPIAELSDETRATLKATDHARTHYQLTVMVGVASVLRFAPLSNIPAATEASAEWPVTGVDGENVGEVERAIAIAQHVGSRIAFALREIASQTL